MTRQSFPIAPQTIRSSSSGDLGRLIHACLLGGAIGDALGADIEFATLSEIRRRFPNGFCAIPTHDGVLCAITDDTQMTLFTAEGLVRAAVRQELRGICHLPSVVHHALLRWLVTQSETPQVELDTIGFVEDARLWARRAPGETCLASLCSAQAFGERARNTSKGCGTIMRVAPIAFLPQDRIRDVAMETSALTHGHPTGQEAAAAWALILADLARGIGIEAAAVNQHGMFGDETDQAISRALQAPRDGAPQTVETLGGGWVAEEALSIALYASLCARDLNHGLAVAVTHSGDSDSTGAIAGNALGLMFPEETLTHRRAQHIECADLIAQVAQDLAFALTGRAAHLADAYPGA